MSYKGTLLKLSTMYLYRINFSGYYHPTVIINYSFLFGNILRLLPAE